MSEAKHSITLEDILPADVARDAVGRVEGVLTEAVSFDAGVIGRLGQPGAAVVAASARVTGRPYFGERARGARITFVADGQPLPTPSFDDATGRILMYYPLSQYEAVAGVLRGSKYILCIYWESVSIDQRGANLHTYDRI